MPYLKFVFLAMLFCLSAFGATPEPAAVAVLQPNPLLWEPTNQDYAAKLTDVSAHFIFNVRNVTDKEVVVEDVKTSCGCTVAQIPEKPWHIAPHETNHMEVLVDLRGKWGKLFKQISVIPSNAPQTQLTVVIDLPYNQPTNVMPAAEANRIWGRELAATDHQAVFKKDCVSCHLTPSFGKYGQQLYTYACGICHEAKHRATMVPDLHALKTEIDTNYWHDWVAYGKAGSLMPGFAAKLGGPLDDDQVQSLVAYLSKAFPRPLKAPIYDDEPND